VRWCSPCSIHLTACNTGVGSPRGPIAQRIADATNCKVYGTRGYVPVDQMSYFGVGQRMHAYRKDWTSSPGPTYPGAVDAEGWQAWNLFQRGQPVQEPNLGYVGPEPIQ
jgi:hypothetical protein